MPRKKKNPLPRGARRPPRIIKEEDDGERGPELKNLPPEILIYIFSLVGPEELYPCLLVSMEWNVFASDDLLWRSFYLYRFPGG